MPPKSTSGVLGRVVTGSASQLHNVPMEGTQGPKGRSRGQGSELAHSEQTQDAPVSISLRKMLEAPGMEEVSGTSPGQSPPP